MTKVTLSFTLPQAQTGYRTGVWRPAETGAVFPYEINYRVRKLSWWRPRECQSGGFRPHLWQGRARFSASKC